MKPTKSLKVARIVASSITDFHDVVSFQPSLVFAAMTLLIDKRAAALVARIDRMRFFNCQADAPVPAGAQSASLSSGTSMALRKTVLKELATGSLNPKTSTK